MIAAKVSALEPLRLESIQELVRSSAPCITVLLPPYRPGEQARSIAALLKSNVKDAARELVYRKVPESVMADLLDPLQQLTEDPELLGGSHWGRAVFRSEQVFRQYELTEPVSPTLKVGGCFEIRSILGQLHLPQEFYLLKLSKKRVGLLRCAALRAEPMKLPKGVPETLEEALALEWPDHDLENRSAAGSSTGAMRRVRFGTGSGRETQHTYLADFYKAVDRGIHQLLHTRGAPLVLAGVDEDTALYRSINKYANLLGRSVLGSPSEALPEADLLGHAYAIVRSARTDRDARTLAETRERVAPARFSTDLDRILGAAVDARVGRLYIDERAQRVGIFEGARRGGRWNWGEEDLLNVTAVETILHGGLVFGLPKCSMPEGAAVAAIFRF